MSQQLRVDWPRCQAHGLCHEMLPEVVALDEWGYPVVKADIPPDLAGLAKRAVMACPTVALRMVGQAAGRE
jgi:ferredoxin